MNNEELGEKMKAIILSVHPEWVAKILNGKKTIEIRKNYPLNYVGWVYMYVTKPKRRYRVEHMGFFSDELYRTPKGEIKFGTSVELMAYEYYDKNAFLNGKVVARFWFDELEEIFWNEERYDYHFPTSYDRKPLKFEKDTGLNGITLYHYGKGKNLYAWHIKNLEVFDTPKELSEFERRYAPQSWCYVEVKEVIENE